MAEHRDGKPPAEALKECEKKVELLKEENAVLRHSSEAFGDSRRTAEPEAQGCRGEAASAAETETSVWQRMTRLRSSVSHEEVSGP